jgi:carbon storage regulator CsrA
MLVLSREAGASIVVRSTDEMCVATVLAVFPASVSVLISRSSASRPGELECRTVNVGVGDGVRIGSKGEMWLVNVREPKARLGIVAPLQSSIHRLEIYEAIQNDDAKHGGGSDPDAGFLGAPVPQPRPSRPPTLDVRLEEPHFDEEVA